MTGEILSLDANEISLDSDRVLKALGYPTAEAASDIVLDALPGWIEQTLHKSTPRSVFQIVKIAANGRLVEVAGGLKFHGKLLADTMSEVSEALLLVVTLGDAVSEWIKQLGQDRALDAMATDAIASELVEAAANRFEQMAGEVIRTGLPYRTLRFSPGYCDWNISELPQLLDLVDPGRIGVSLTAGGMMTPQKTIAGMTGLSGSLEAAKRNPCERCGKNTCDHRRASL